MGRFSILETRKLGRFKKYFLCNENFQPDRNKYLITKKCIRVFFEMGPLITEYRVLKSILFPGCPPNQTNDKLG